jgi:mono/diheme cytochrome c family protein
MNTIDRRRPMKLKRLVVVLSVAVIVGTVILSGCGGAQDESAQDSVSVSGEVLLEERCTECHGLDRVTSLEQTRGEWEQTVENMINRGAQLTEDEKTVLVDYLADEYGS